ncbi:hypothetical protein GCM10023405_17390 [Streptomonospora salina]
MHPRRTPPFRRAADRPQPGRTPTPARRATSRDARTRGSGANRATAVRHTAKDTRSGTPKPQIARASHARKGATTITGAGIANPAQGEYPHRPPRAALKAGMCLLLDNWIVDGRRQAAENRARV